MIVTDVRTWTEHVHVYVQRESADAGARRLLLDLTCSRTAVQCSEWYDCCLVLVHVVESTRYDHRQTGETYFEVTVRLRLIASFQIKDGLLTFCFGMKDRRDCTFLVYWERYFTCTGKLLLHVCKHRKRRWKKPMYSCTPTPN